MNFPERLITGTLIKRYKRFLADVLLDNGDIVTAHCPNTGSMQGCAISGSKVWLSESNDPKRKLAYTWQLIACDNSMIGINTHLANKLVLEAITNGTISDFSGYTNIRTEVKYGKENSRIDLLIDFPDYQYYVEVKNVTLIEEGTAYFPDAITQRGQKHIRELMYMVDQGHKAAVLFCIQHTGATTFTTASHIDKEYAELLSLAKKHGVSIFAYRAAIEPAKVLLTEKVIINI